MPRKRDAGGVSSTLRPQSISSPPVSDLGQQLGFSSTAELNALLYDEPREAAAVSGCRLPRS